MACLKIMYGLEQALRDLLGKVAEDYGLDYVEMERRYFGDVDGEVVAESIASSPPLVRRAVAAPPKKDETLTMGLCKGLTTKGAPCKKKAMAGGCYCSTHAKKKDDPPAAEAAEKKKRPAAKKKGEAAVVHRHAVEDEVHEGCEGCEVHGYLADTETDLSVAADKPTGLDESAESASPAYEVRGSVRTRMMEMLSRVAALDDEVVEEDE